MSALGIAATLVLGLAAAGIGVRSGVPGAAVVLPIVVVAVWNAVGPSRNQAIPGWMQVLAFGSLGTTIGLSIQRQSLDALRTDWAIVVLIAGSVYVAALVLMFIVTRLTHLDLATTLLAGSPGGLAGVAAVSLTVRADVALVAAAQTLRIVLIYTTLPFIAGLIKSGSLPR